MAEDFFSMLMGRRAAVGLEPTVSQDDARIIDPPDLQQAFSDAQALAARQLEQEIKTLAQTGTFDAEYYKQNYPDIVAAGIDPLDHFFRYGFKEGRKPSFYFDPLWYLEANPDVRDAGMQPLLHYALYGDFEGRRPCAFFDPAWYRTQYGLAEAEGALAHFLAHRTDGRSSPLSEFDVEYYLRVYPDIAAARVDPFEHFLTYGFKEGRNPSADFDVKFYSARYLKDNSSENPFLHYLAHQKEPGVYGRLPDHETTIPREIKRFTQPAAEFEEFRPLPVGATRRAKLLAYYLPQFHAFPENDAWWGAGFTEWTNIARGVPRFRGHYQPRIPRDLGFYTLDSSEPMRRQAEMAKAGGVYGFVFYYYWFNGHRLLERPVDLFLADRSVDIPFCLMWANENWTRRWDGAESEILISQDYRVEDDDQMISEFVRHFRDPRYIRVQGRPLLMVYRPTLIPDPKKSIARWRAIFRERFHEDPLFIMAQSFHDVDPELCGLDGAIEFPPHKLTQRMPPNNAEIEVLDPEFSAKVYRYEDTVKASLDEPKPNFPLIKTAMPSWDNDARRQGHGVVVTGSTPAKYEAWLSRLVKHAEENPFFGEAFVCVNAWNEWCEGTYLEPDLHYGAAYLNATGRAITGATQRAVAGHRLLLVGHDAFPSGAQLNLFNIGRTLRRSYGVEIEFLLLDGGKLADEYRAIAPLTIAANDAGLDNRLATWVERGFTHAIVNTTAAAGVVPRLLEAGIQPIVLVHELPRIIRDKHLTASARVGIESARHVIFAAPFVRDQVLADLGIPSDERMLILPQGNYQQILPAPEAGAAIRAELGISAVDHLFIGVGYADLRKGFDLFVQLWRLLRDARLGTVHACWVGSIDPDIKHWFAQEIADAESSGTFHMVGHRSDIAGFYSAANAFALTSREDPFPTVVLEALGVGLPVFAFDKSGGIPDVLRSHAVGTVVPYGDVVAMADAIAGTMRRGITEAERRARRALVAEQFDFRVWVGNLLQLAMPSLPTVSVVVPNYNYARFMPQRLGTIFEQSHPVHEVIVLDDCSTDDSLTVIPAIAREWQRELRLVPNAINSGSVFAQWRKAAELATGEFLWIAEADDLSDPDFLSRTLALMAADSSIQLAFSDSRAINSDGSPLWPSYKEYYATVEPGALTQTEVFEAPEFVRRFLSVKNLILNVSAVVWRREALLRALDVCQEGLKSHRMAGDWRLYLQALTLEGARIAYEATPLNHHRRHAQSVTHALAADRHVEEIAQIHDFARTNFPIGGEEMFRQRSYIEEVGQQLGASNETVMRLTAVLEPIPEPVPKSRLKAHNKPRHEQSKKVRAE